MGENSSETNHSQSEDVDNAEESSYETTQGARDNNTDSYIASTTDYPKTSSPSSVDFDNINEEFDISTSTTDILSKQTSVYNSEVKDSRKGEEPLSSALGVTYTKKQNVQGPNYQTYVNSQKNLAMETHACKKIKNESTTTSTSTERCKQTKRRSNRRRSNEESNIDRKLANYDSENSYPYSETDHNYMKSDSIQSSKITDTDGEFSNGIFKLEKREFATSIEHDIVATKYGLPYDIIDCICNSEQTIGSSKARSDKDPRIRPAKSCYNFQERYGKIDIKIFKIWNSSRKSKEFQRACTVYDMFVKEIDPKMQKAFTKSDCGLRIFYPNYWVHLVKKYVTNLEEYDHVLEMRSKLGVIVSCQRVLKEQEIFSRHYKVRMTDLGRYIKFSREREDIDENFEKACTFLKKEYPTLFVYLIKKYQFSKLVITRMTIEKNRLQFIKKWRAPYEIIIALDDKYRLNRKTSQ